MDKLTETLGVRVTAELQLVIKSVAEMHGLTPGEWVRSLIDDALHKERARYEALTYIFGERTAQTNRNGVSHG